MTEQKTYWVIRDNSTGDYFDNMGFSSNIDMAFPFYSKEQIELKIRIFPRMFPDHKPVKITRTTKEV